MENWTGRRVEVEVGAVAHGGHCVARVEGRVVFVRHALPGEHVVAEVTEDRGGSFCRADAVEVLVASPDRVTPPCPVARPGGCGGCDWQHASAAAQRDLKAAVVAEQLRRLADLEVDVPVEELPVSGAEGALLRWRTRVRLVADAQGRAGFRAHRSHRVIPVTDCPITVPGALDDVVARTWPPAAEVSVVADGAGTVHVTELTVVRDGTAGGAARRSSQGRPSRGRVPQLRAHLRAGGGVAVEHAAGREWRVAAEGFWQVHPAAADVLAGVVGEWSVASPGAVAWDLYGGAGLFAAVLAGQVGPEGSVLVVESSREAVADGEANLADLPQVRFRAGTVERVLDDPELADERPEVVVLDPPRKGAGRAVVDAVAGRTPARVVYVACDPAALARDVAEFARHGYRLAALRAFDAFPMTHHVECVALLSRME